MSQESKLVQTDIAALSVSCVAASLSMVLESGPFDHFSIVLSLTLLAIILASFLGKELSRTERIAYSAGIALALVPLWGFVIETALSRDQIAYALGGYEWTCQIDSPMPETIVDPCEGPLNNEDSSRVEPIYLLGVWAVTAAITAALLFFLWRKKR